MTIPVISLFSGAGGLDLGVEDAGGEIHAAVEPDPSCAATLRSNPRFFRRLHVIDRPIEKVSSDELLQEAGLRSGEVGLLVGGPPCQPFSKSGYWLQERRRGLDDPRARMLDHFLRVLRQIRPEGFIFENVGSLSHPSSKQALTSLLRRARRYGYATEWRMIRAVEFGVPQTRVRLFVLGLRKPGVPRFPEPTHWWPSQNGSGAKLQSPETAGRWIAPFSGKDFEEPGEIANGRWRQHLREIPPGWNYKFHTAWANHPRPTFVTETRYWSFLLKLSPYRPSWTIQASAGPWTGPLHWDSRRLRIPELAALQTFPNAFNFAGTLVQRRRQIGNAVPSLLASRVTAGIVAEIAGARARRGRRLRYELVSGYEFDPATVRKGGHSW